MLSLYFELSVPGFSSSEIGPVTLVRANPANLQISVTNDGPMTLYKLNVKPVVESYVGLDKPMLFSQFDAQTIEQIAPKTKVALTFVIRAHFPGLVAVAIYVTDVANNAVMIKRQHETAYEQVPVRWWVHVVDNISVETLKALKALVAQKPKDAKKPRIIRPKEKKR